MQLHLLWVPGSHIRVAAASGGPVGLHFLQVVVVVVPWRPVTCAFSIITIHGLLYKQTRGFIAIKLIRYICIYTYIHLLIPFPYHIYVLFCNVAGSISLYIMMFQWVHSRDHTQPSIILVIISGVNMYTEIT